MEVFPIKILSHHALKILPASLKHDREVGQKLAPSLALKKDMTGRISSRSIHLANALVSPSVLNSVKIGRSFSFGYVASKYSAIAKLSEMASWSSGRSLQRVYQFAVFRDG